MTCVVLEITGDYAIIKYLETANYSEVALALLPRNVDVGDILKFENYEFSYAD
jgi:hypothetical protein